MAQLSLFAPLEGPVVVSVPGLAYEEAFVTEEEESRLLRAVYAEDWNTDWQRRVQRYGAVYGERSSLEARPPIPPWLVPLGERLTREGHLVGPASSVVVNEYVAGQGIGMHKDYPAFGDAVAAVSLGSACMLEWEGPRGEHATLDVAPRSLFVFRGEARWEWKHGIRARLVDVVGGKKRPRRKRVSITFRTLRA